MYRFEVDAFRDRFGQYRDRRIVLYGIGRCTATLIEGLSKENFHFVGLMDKNHENVGKTMFGLLVMDQGEVEKCADMVIINTSEIYWNVIYSRIKGIKIPVFYKNGKPARLSESENIDNPFRNLSNAALCAEIQKAEVVSFDFFDTLFMRSVCNPRDIFSLLEAISGKNQQTVSCFLEMRNQAEKSLRNNYSLDELYTQIGKLYQTSSVILSDMKAAEVELEHNLLIPRPEILRDLQLSIECGKDVYIVSDMYLPIKFYQISLSKYGLFLPSGHILLSNELNSSKADGSMWRYYVEKITKGRFALHIGDNQDSDVKRPAKYGLNTYQVPSVWDLLMVSSIKDVAAHICCDYASAVMGCVLGKLFEDPFILENTNGMIRIRDAREMGYCVFGPILLTFLLWLLEQSDRDGATKLIFMSRDGYFLKEDFEYLCELVEEQRSCCYLGISRQLAMTAAVQSKSDLMELLSVPYVGNTVEMLKDRLEMTNIPEIQGGTLENYVEKYGVDIEAHVSVIRKNYLQYVNQMKLDDTCAIVDIGYSGTIQRYLNKLTGLNMQGYYFNADLSEKNKFAKTQKMIPCFQEPNDPTGQNSQVLKYYLCLESFLTAPYGMIQSVDQDGIFQCAESGENQKHFMDKEMINQGVKQLIYDYTMRFSKFELQTDREFVDWFYGLCMGGSMEFSEDVKKSFYMDNAMMSRNESMLFY